MTTFIIHSLELLRILDQEIATRCEAIATAQGDWPCRRGCDDCCRNLAQEPLLTRAEWERLAPHVPDDAERGTDEPEAAEPDDPRVCPLLNRATGACRVYEVRPIACRTYGFYVERDQGLYCAMIRRRVDSGEYNGVVWGNQAGIDRRLDALGERRPLSSWRRGTPAP